MIAFNEDSGTSAPVKQVTLTDIEGAASAFAIARADLADTVREMERKLDEVRLQFIKQIRKELAKAADKQAVLRALIEAAPQLFEKPRTLVVMGVKVGFRKGTGGIDWEDDAKVCELIEKHFSKTEAELLIKTTKKPIAKALADLDVASLKKIGCTVESTGDVVVIKPQDSEVDKVINALLKEPTDEAVAGN